MLINEVVLQDFTDFASLVLNDLARSDVANAVNSLLYVVLV